MLQLQKDLIAVYVMVTMAHSLAMSADSSYLPLSSNQPGHITDLALIYQGDEKRLAWTGEQLSSYVTWTNPVTRLEEWLFDGFLFIEFSDGRGREYAAGYTHNPARQLEWRWLLERNFSTTNALGALDDAVGQAIARLGKPPVPRQVVLTLPEPIRGQTNWGIVAGKNLDFQLSSDRITACKWHMDQGMELWRNAKLKHLRLAGFYWVAEQATHAQDILPPIAKALHQRELRFYWIPYWNANGAARWRELGFDFAWQQPNHFFHPDKVPDERLGIATKFARTHGLGLEFEADARAISQPQNFRPRLHAYLDAFARDGVKTNASVAYYEGGGALLQMARSDDPDVRALYHAVARWVSERQKLLNPNLTQP